MKRLILILFFFINYIIIYAAASAKYTLTFDANGGLIPTNGNMGSAPSGYTSSLSADRKTGSVVVIRNTMAFCDMPKDCPTRTGYTFEGWYTDKTAGTQVYNASGYCVVGKYWNSDKKWIGTSNLALYAHWKAIKYTISTSATNGTISGAGTYDYNTSVTLKATPKEHYHFVKWSDGNTSNPRIITVTGNATYTAVFALDQFTITATSEYGSVIGSGTYNYGATATLTATNSDCYTFQKWSDGNTNNPRKVVVTQDSTFSAIFVETGYQETVQCTVVNKSPYGTVSFTDKVIKDSNILLKATAPECSQFVKWSDNNTDNPRSVEMTQDSTFTAIFEKINFTITIDANPEQGDVVEETENQ